MMLPTTVLLCLLVSPAQSLVVDLSHVHTPETFAFVDSYERLKSEDMILDETVVISSSVLRAPEHSGTHMDSPSHFIKDGYTLDQVPVEWTIKEGVVIDCRREAAQDRDYLATQEKLVEWESANGRIPNGAAVLFDFGWSDRYTDLVDYVGSDNLTDFFTFHQPSVSPEAGAWLFHERDTRILGVDTLSPDPIRDAFPNHVLYLSDGRLIVENLKIPSSMPARGFRFHATPPKYKDATGTQVRAFAMMDDGDHVADGACAIQLTCVAALSASILWALL